MSRLKGRKKTPQGDSQEAAARLTSSWLSPKKGNARALCSIVFFPDFYKDCSDILFHDLTFYSSDLMVRKPRRLGRGGSAILVSFR